MLINIDSQKALVSHVSVPDSLNTEFGNFQERVQVCLPSAESKIKKQKPLSIFAWSTMCTVTNLSAGGPLLSFFFT
jgi:hypothetical protein